MHKVGFCDSQRLVLPFWIFFPPAPPVVWRFAGIHIHPAEEQQAMPLMMSQDWMRASLRGLT